MVREARLVPGPPAESADVAAFGEADAVEDGGDDREWPLRPLPPAGLLRRPVGIAASVTTHDNRNPRTVADLILRFSVMEDAPRSWRKDDGFLYVSLILLAGDRRTDDHAYVWAEFRYSVHELNDFDVVPELSPELRDTLERLGVFRLTRDGEIAQPPPVALLVWARHV